VGLPLDLFYHVKITKPSENGLNTCNAAEGAVTTKKGVTLCKVLADSDLDFITAAKKWCVQQDVPSCKPNKRQKVEGESAVSSVRNNELRILQGMLKERRSAIGMMGYLIPAFAASFTETGNKDVEEEVTSFMLRLLPTSIRHRVSVVVPIEPTANPTPEARKAPLGEQTGIPSDTVRTV